MRISGAVLAPFRTPLFRAVWLTSLVSNIGALAQSVGASWWMTSLGSPQMVALVRASITLPIMLLALPAGALADIVDLRRLLLAAQAMMPSVAVALGVWDP